MSEERCPNCRAERVAGDTQCRQCGWMPLQSTEMLFVDDQQVACPDCGQQRSVTDKTCPHCGAQGVLESLSPHTANFHISSLMLLTTLIAVCFALARVAQELGILAFVILGLATLRTAVLIRERKRHRYPLLIPDMLRMFGWSLLGIIAAIMAFGSVMVLGGFFITALLEAIWHTTPVTAAILLVLMVVAIEVGAMVMVGWRGESGRMLLIGVATAWSSGLFAFIAVRSMPRDIAPLMLMLPPIIIVVTALLLACRHGGCNRIKSFLVGCSAGLCTLGGAAALYPVIPLHRDVAMAFGYSSAMVLWPTLLCILALQSMWSWDDAFPQVAGRRQDALGTESLNRPGITLADQEGIEFPDESPDSANPLCQPAPDEQQPVDDRA